MAPDVLLLLSSDFSSEKQTTSLFRFNDFILYSLPFEMEQLLFNLVCYVFLCFYLYYLYCVFSQSLV